VSSLHSNYIARGLAGNLEKFLMLVLLQLVSRSHDFTWSRPLKKCIYNCYPKFMDSVETEFKKSLFL
jgi:hypothetical protein